jgi:hypothetical protein
MKAGRFLLAERPKDFVTRYETDVEIFCIPPWNASPYAHMFYFLDISKLSLWLCSPLLDLGRFFCFSHLFTQSVGLLGRGMSPSQGRYLHTGQHKQNKRTQTSISQVGFEGTIPVFEQAKTVHVLDRAATVIDKLEVN